MRKIFARSIATALTAVTIATSFPVMQASAASAPAVAKAAPITSDFSARRQGNANAAIALGAFALIAGVAIAASQHDNCGPYGCGYVYGPAPGPYYGYGRGYHRSHHGYQGRHWR